MMVVKTSLVKRKYSLNCLVVADDAAFALDTKVKVEELGLRVKTIASTAEEVDAALHSYPIDIILSEENLNDTNCVKEIYDTMENLPPLILFSDLDSISAQEKAIAASPYVSISRPFEEVTLKLALGDALKNRINALKENGDIRKEQDTLYIRSSGKLISLEMNEINYIKAEGNYCTIHIDSKRFVIRSSISNVLKTLDRPNFVQIHRGYIANVNPVHELAISKGNLKVVNQELPIGRKYKNELVSMMKYLEC